MKPSLRALSLVVSVTLASGLVGTPALSRAQSPSGSTEAAKTQSEKGPKKPVRKPDQELTNDPVALLAVRKAPPYIAPATAQAVATATDEMGVVPEDPEKRAAEMASLEKQIQDKQKRIVLLMRLFVNDERPFLNDPGNPKGDEASQDRRKYEQDELLWETAELAKLKARLNELKTAETEVEIRK
jgi:hypothetical protein